MHFLDVCLIKLVSAIRFGLGIIHDVFNFCTLHGHASFMHTFFLFLFYSELVLCFLLFCSVLFSLSLSQIEPLYVTQTEKIHSGLEPSSWFQVILLWSFYSISFRDKKAKTDFFENFQNCGVHRECRVILSDFSDTTLLDVIRTRGWEPLCEKPVHCPVVFTQEFYSNIHGIDTFVPQFVSTFRGARIVVTPDIVSDVLHVPREVHPNYLDCAHLRTVSKDDLISHFCETSSI